MSHFDPLRNPIKNARGLGSAKEGVHHFIVQRITALALLVLAVYFVVLIVSLAGADYATARAAVAHPCNAVLLVAFLVAMFWHGQLGMQVVIEDYVHTPWLAMSCQLAVRVACAFAALASVFAVVRIALGA
ncbi:MAG: succinate dehydrogenase, hydrophobic membrane anchor protein [Dokdonella sp.]|uniref:succinate dehydrogenase, hydrophobic membrane anchor protein n=1 Tax=Dokdonella sp. TaxID=2291710 RepID=UPI002BAA5A90|nr:succinate dehydrogenase, hydrophobic membrane anchor protein [Dokdonella sp.]HOX71373.1 succinate dehydrogenase, hydrophobic membrane anchor protein [Dokdonella sp.]HPG94075.1 succinate dehydrogenase, hydrophobic membrane anchor protein [Dokdonella sp.]HPN79448.1 succinate dehydrogenase, hydrophobic membrane anchor protein [Dokdonella sp.]